MRGSKATEAISVKIVHLACSVSSPDLRFAVILGLDPRISSQRILKF
ncbi:MAG: hypothetical protein MR878_04005 [Campylobacter sp.]|nr:hypothetical protein [Campylobacter sp.]